MIGDFRRSFVHHRQIKEVIFVNLNYTKILHFLTIVKHMNMNKAANELYVSQPALSLSISRLEEDLGIVLFYRDKNKLILSREAKLLLPRFRQLQTDYEDLVREAGHLKDPLQDKFINISFSGSKFFFSSLHLTGILDQFDQAIVKFCYLNIDQAVEMLLSGQVDIAISCPLIRNPRIATVDLLTEPIGLALPKGHPMAVQDRVSLTDLQSVTIYGLSKENTFRQLCDKLFRAHNIQIHYTSESNMAAYHRLMEKNDSSSGFLVTPTNFSMTLKGLGDYVYLPIDDGSICRKMGISYLTESDIQYRYADFIALMRENIQKLNEHHHLVGQSMMEHVMEW